MNSNKTKLAVTIEPKKSARLAHKRKLREEAGPSLGDDDYYFSPYSYGKTASSSYGKSGLPQTQNSPSVSPGKSEGSKVKPHKLSPSSFKSHGFDSKSIQNRADASNVSESSRSPSPNFLIDCFEEVSMNKGKKILPIVRSSSSLGSPLITKKGVNTPTGSCTVTSGFSSLQLKEDEESLDEEKWLDALEAGKLEDLDEELRQIKNPTALTARQKAILEKRDKNYVLFDEPEDISTNANKVMTEEMLQLKAQKTERRRLLAQAKKESDQKKTVEKLLNKPYSKGGRNAVKNKGPPKPVGPVITRITGPGKDVIIFPPNMEVPYSVKKPTLSVPDVLCGVSGCNNTKKYRCSKTDTPLCSLKCYKKNLDFNFFSVADSFGCESTMCEAIEDYESAVINGEIYPELM